MPDQSDLTNCINAINMISPVCFSFAGKEFETVSADALIKSLTGVIYDQCYSKKFTGSYQEFIAVTTDNTSFQSALSLANTTTERWDKNWIIEQVLPSGQYVVIKNKQYKLVYPGEFITADYQSALPRQGAGIAIHCLKESAGIQPSFYFAFSEEPNDQPSLFTLLRFYWNLKSSGAAKLIGLLTASLNKYSIPFSFKCLNNPDLYTRTDAAVLYVSKPYYTITSSIIKEVYPQINSELNPGTPLFSKELIHGLGLAEDPGNGQSFGMSRCGLIAKGIYQAYQSGSDKIQQVKKVFKENNINLSEPYLNAGSTDNYEYNN